jgi:hypothetical protein
MAATSFTFGLASATGFVQSVEVSGKMDEKLIVDKDGSFAQAYCYNPTYDISVNGVGSNPESIAATTIGVVTASNFGASVVIITGVTETQKADDFPSFSITAKGYKSGVTVGT